MRLNEWYQKYHLRVLVVCFYNVILKVCLYSDIEISLKSVIGTAML